MPRYSLPAGEYFEALVASHAASTLGVLPAFSGLQIEQLRLRAMPHHEREERRAPGAAQKLAEHVFSLGCVPQEVRHVGGHRSAEGVPSDLDIVCADRVLHYSLKSTAAGKGTVRNWGVGTLESALPGVTGDIVARALAAIRTAIAREDDRQVIDLRSFAAAKRSRDAAVDGRLVSRHYLKRIDTVAKAAYAPFKTELRDRVIAYFNALPVDQRAAFIIRFLGVDDEGKGAFLLVAEDKGTALYATSDLHSYLATAQLHAAEFRGGNSLVFMSGSDCLFRGNSSATNHQGLSDPCIRFFELPAAAALLLAV